MTARITTRVAFAGATMTKASMKTLVRNPARLTDALVQSILSASRAEGAGDAWYSFQQCELLQTGLRTCYLDRLDALAQPTLVLAGAQDKLVPFSDCAAAVDRLPNARREVLDPCGHWIARDQPDRFVSAVTEFVT